MKALLIILALASVPFLYQACASSAAPPGPLAETPVPITLKFVEPNLMHVDHEVINQVPIVNENISVAKAVGDIRRDIVIFGANFEDNVYQQFFEPALNGISKIEMPSDQLITRLDMVVEFTPEPEVGLFTGTHQVTLECNPGEGLPADFDVDGDGTLDTCSGYCNALPACIFLKLGGAPHLVWYFVEAQDEDGGTIGEGLGRILAPDLDGFKTEISFIYKQTAAAPTDKSFEMFLKASNNYTKQFTGFGAIVGGFRVFDWHLLSTEALTDVGTEGSTSLGESMLKTINLAANIELFDGDYLEDGVDNDGDGTIDEQDEAEAFIRSFYLGRYLTDSFIDDRLFWSGSLESFGEDFEGNPQSTIGTIENICVDVTGDPFEGREVETQYCDDLGISVLGIDYVDLLIDSDVAFPPELL